MLLQILTSYFLLLPLREDAGISLGAHCWRLLGFHTLSAGHVLNHTAPTVSITAAVQWTIGTLELAAMLTHSPDTDSCTGLAAAWQMQQR
jgi:hypothetical protein